MNTRRIIAAALVLVFWAAEARSQDIPTDTVNVTGRYRPIIRDAEKMNLLPENDDTSTVKRAVDIAIDPKAMEVSFHPKEIKAATLGSKSDTPLKKGHAIVGFGNYTTPYGELFYNTGRSRSHQSGLHIRHISSTGEIGGFGDAAYSQNDVSAYSHIFGSHQTFHGKVFYDRDMVNFYGFHPDSFPSLDFAAIDTRQVFHVAGADIGVDNVDDHANMYYDFKAGYRFLSSLDSMQEHIATGKLSLFAEPDLIRAAKDQELGIDIEYQFRHSAIDTSEMRQDHLLAIKPYMEGVIDEFDIHAGLQVWMEADTASRFRVFPDIHVTLNLIPNTLSLYTGISGGIHSHSFLSYSRENLFISRELELGNSVQKLRIFGGAKVALGRKIDAVIHLEMANYASMPFFVNDTSLVLQNRFTVVEDEDITVSRIGAEISYWTGEKFKVRTQAYYNGFSLTHLSDPWHKPRFEWKSSLDYSLREKIIATVEFNYLAGIKARGFTQAGMETAIDLNPVLDLNLVIEYRFSKAFAAYIQGNNLLGQQQYMWYNYPSQGIRILGGVSYSM